MSAIVSLFRGRLVVRNFWLRIRQHNFCLSFQFQPRFSVSLSHYTMPAGW